MESITICTLNINGLRNKIKRKNIFSKFKKEKYDFVCLQETYISEDDKKLWEMEWGGQIFFSSGSKRSLGQVILIKKDMQFEVKFIYKSARIITISFESTQGTIFLINAYAPNAPNEKHEFFLNLLNHLNQLEGEKILCGDFNCVLDNKYDIVSGESHRQCDVNCFKDLILDSTLNDAWRLFHQEEKVFTWCRKNPFIARRLDYIFVTDLILNNTLSCFITSIANSDHKAVILKYSLSSVKRGPSYWKFNNNLLNDLQFVRIMNNMLEAFEIENENLNDPQTKWDLCKIKIRELSLSFSKEKRKKEKNSEIILIQELNSIDSRLASNPNNRDLIAQRERIKLHLEVYTSRAAKSAQVRSRVKFIEEGEKNTKYFLNLEKARANDKIMDRLKTPSGIITNQSSILEEQVKYYKEIHTINRPFKEDELTNFLHDTNVKQISEEQKNTLDSEITEKEFLAALKLMKNDSAPGPDGITTSFIKMFWIKIGTMIVNSFNAAFLTKQLSYSQRQAVITLIHKGKDLPRDELSNWRPISLTNTDYKLLSKTLAVRLSGVLDVIINENQVGFVKGRKISNLIRLIDDTIDCMNLLKKPGLLLAVDYRRAFDTISKDFILSAFKRFGFGSNFVNWVNVLLKNTESRLNYCGWISESFPIQCGIRQGCPFSPMAFIVALELLAIKIRKEETIKGIKIPSSHNDFSLGNIIKIILFADDITLFLQDNNDLKIVLNILDIFTNISNLEVNRNKTEAMWLGSKVNCNKSYYDINWKPKIKILGIYFCNTVAASLIEENWTSRLEKIQKLISIWNKRNLSISGKICIIKTFLLSQFVYALQSLVAPEYILNKINSLIFRFLWKRKNTNKRAFEKVKRNVLCSASSSGGLNMINVKDMQISFLSMWAINLIEAKNQPWFDFPNFLFSKLGCKCSCFYSDVKPKHFQGLEYINSVFWKNVLITWLDNKDKIVTNSDVTQKLNMCLWNNSKIKYKNNCLFFNNWAKGNINYIYDIVNNGDFISFDGLRELLGDSPILLFQYNAIRSALLADAAVGLLRSAGAGLRVDERPRVASPVTARAVRRRLSAALVVTPCCVHFWQRKYNIEIVTDHWKLAIKSTKEERLRLLHWKILHNIYPTNILLHKMKLRDTNLCSYCKETDYIEHFFYHCNKIKKIWQSCTEFILFKTGNKINLSETDVLLGYRSNKLKYTLVRFINHIILITKLVISKYKYGTPFDICYMFQYEIEIRHKQLLF